MLVIYLTISAWVDPVLIISISGNIFLYIVFNKVVDRLGPPKIILFWVLKSSMALASVRNSGLKITSISGYREFILAVVPGVIVDLITTVLQWDCVKTSFTALSTKLVSHLPLLFIGVGKHIKTISWLMVASFDAFPFPSIMS